MRGKIILAVVAMLCVVTAFLIGLSVGKKTIPPKNASVEPPPETRPVRVAQKPNKKPEVAKPDAAKVPPTTVAPASPVNAKAKVRPSKKEEDVEEDPDDESETPMEDSPDLVDEEEKVFSGSVAQKVSALVSLVDYRTSQTAPGKTKTIPPALAPYWGNDTENGDGDESSEEQEEGWENDVDPEGEEFRNTVNLLTLALEDTSSDVRDAAFDAMFKIPEAERSVLSLQILGGEDDALKEGLLEIAGNATDEFSLTLLMQALDDENGTIKDKAATRLGELLSETFSTSDEALEWWEENHENYEFTDQGVVPLSVDGDPANGEQPTTLGQ